MPATHRQGVLRAYRELLGLIRRLPEAERVPKLQEARQAVRSNAGETKEDKQIDLLRLMHSKISFLRMMTPKRPGDNRGAGHFVYRGGDLVEGKGEAPDRVATGILDINDARKLHHQLLKRQYFGKEPPKIKTPF